MTWPLALASFVLGVTVAVSVVAVAALCLSVDDLEQGWESVHYHESPTPDHPESHHDDGPP